MLKLNGPASGDKSSPFDRMDSLYQAGLARLTLGISPAGLASALAQLAQAPGKSAQIALYPFFKGGRKDNGSLTRALNRITGIFIPGVPMSIIFI